jgi:hypothetical protein
LMLLDIAQYGLQRFQVAVDIAQNSAHI